MSDVLVKLNISAPTPLMHLDAAVQFGKMRNEVAVAAGFDFFGKCGDVFRPAGYVSKKDGVANRSFHKTGRAVDYDQTSKALVIVSEPLGGKQYFRTYLKCADQYGSMGVKRTLKDIRGQSVTAFVIDLTAIAEKYGFNRIPAWNGWRANYNRREFWHYQYNPQNLTWDDAMLQLRGKSRPAAEKVLGLNDRGQDVRDVQAKLIAKGYLAAKELDGVFGAKTKAAVVKFQAAGGLAADGLVGPNTRAKLFGA